MFPSCVPPHTGWASPGACKTVVADVPAWPNDDRAATGIPLKDAVLQRHAHLITLKPVAIVPPQPTLGNGKLATRPGLEIEPMAALRREIGPIGALTGVFPVGSKPVAMRPDADVLNVGAIADKPLPAVFCSQCPQIECSRSTLRCPHTSAARGAIVGVEHEAFNPNMV